MPEQPSQTGSQPRVRSDARRNRERLLEVARELFVQHGAEASLDEIARRAKVGSGTLYRHFPTRDALLEAVFRDQVHKLVSAGEQLSAALQPAEALRAWMLEFIDYVVAKLLILPAMEAVPGGSTRLIEGTRGEVHGTFRRLVEHAIASGDLDPATDPDDLFRAFVGVFHTTQQPGWEPSARRIVGILLQGCLRRSR